jgi:2-hydroxychromene-2-carboxylate isomerase
MSTVRVAFAAPACMANSRGLKEAHLPSAEFWYEFASTYSYPAALRVAALADERGVSLVWRPFLLGPIFFAQGWRDSPFNVYPAKGR